MLSAAVSSSPKRPKNLLKLVRTSIVSLTLSLSRLLNHIMERFKLFDSGVGVIDLQKRPWADLPPELLSMIVDRLGLIELLGFRGVCKGWRSASSTASAENECAESAEASFLVFGQDGKCNFYYQKRNQMYKSISIPELEKATCLASNQGWLLLFQQGSSFFFCPFSRARIDLPQFPHSELTNHIGVFSAPPTSPDCIVSIANLRDNSKVELHLLHRGVSIWKKHEFYRRDLNNITSAFYYDKKSCFYFADNASKLLKFSTKKEKWSSYNIVSGNDPRAEVLPYYTKAHYLRASGMKAQMGLLDDFSISTCGTYFSAKKNWVLITNEKEEPPQGQECAGLQLKGVWIHPRFFQIPPSTVWSL